jgi:sialate O-acetylesterase
MHRIAAVCFLGVVMVMGSPRASTEVRLPKLVGNGMVLQRDAKVRLWGWANAGEQVSIQFLGKTYWTRTRPDSGWSIALPPLKAGGPYSMEIDGTNHIVLSDILIGDVWVCSGQSNMELPMLRVKPRYEEAIAHAENPHIRQFVVPHRYNFRSPQEDLPSGQWEQANPWSVLHFTATGYFFARSLWEKYHVPIGLINASVGGTPIQSWMSRDALRDFPGDIARGEMFGDPSFRDSVRHRNDSIRGAWYGRVWSEDQGRNSPVLWSDPSYDATSWQTMTIPGYWSEAGAPPTNGVVWFRRTFTVSSSLADQPALLLMGRIVDADYEYINGVFVGSVSYQYPPRRFDVAPGVLKAGTNVIVVRVINENGRGGFIPDKPYEVSIAGHTINLAGRWQYRVGATADPLPGPTVIDYQPLGFFQGMISPLLQYSIKGVIWYQGESNAGNPAGYDKMFPAMMTDWRTKWGEGDFPFLFVQLPNYGVAVDHPTESGMAQVREAQRRALALPHTGMAVAIDIGEWNDIHPLDKGDVGKRLALAAEKVAYGDTDVVSSGPVVRSVQRVGKTMVLSFTSVGRGLVAKGGGPLRRFEISDDGKNFVEADARISGTTVIVSSPSVAVPTTVRYAWADNPSGANLFNREGLPAPPFELGE